MCIRDRPRSIVDVEQVPCSHARTPRAGASLWFSDDDGPQVAGARRAGSAQRRARTYAASRGAASPTRTPVSHLARHVGRIYGLMLTAWSAGAVLGPLIVSHLRDATGEYTRGLQIIAVLMLGAAILPIVLHAPGPA